MNNEDSAVEGQIPLAVLRRTLERYTRATSIRTVAAQLGMGHTSLHKFITGSVVPRQRTRRSMEAFCLQALLPQLPAEEEVNTALCMLTEHLPAAAGQRVREGIVAFVAGETLALGAELPGWMRDEE